MSTKLRAGQLISGNIEFLLDLLSITRSDSDFADDARAFLADHLDELGRRLLILIEVAIAPVAAAGFDRNLHDDAARLVGRRRAAAVGRVDGRR